MSGIPKRIIKRWMYEMASEHWAHQQHSMCEDGWGKCECRMAQLLRELDKLTDRKARKKN